MRTRSCNQVGDLFNPLIPLKRGSDCFMFIMHDDADTRVILTPVERFLLPEHDDRYFVKHNQKCAIKVRLIYR